VISRLNLLMRARRKAGRVGRYLRMMAQYDRARRAGVLPRPIVIVCQNRTGSTFLNRLFGAHPQCWTYTHGSHQEAMREEDCPHWLSGQPFLRRWRVKHCPPWQRHQTRVWMASMAKGSPFGVFKIPHALAKVLSLQDVVPDLQPVLLVRHPAAQVASAIATNNPPDNLRVTADALIQFLENERSQVRRLQTVRYESLLARPAETFSGLCAALGLDAQPQLIAKCVDEVGVVPGSFSHVRTVPDFLRDRVARLCRLLDYDWEPRAEVPGGLSAGARCARQTRIDAETGVALHSARERPFRGAQGDTY
jgi:hypothetical protein